MRARSVVRLTLLVTAVALVLPGTAPAQTGGIAGEVADTTGGVLPGVTVTATTPSAIAVRTTVTDGQGLYVLTALVSGTYVVEFTLPGFSTVQREGVELVGGFTANIDIQMAVGGVEETVTVTGATPTVDVVNTRTQQVLGSELLNLLPNSGTVTAFAQLTLGASVGGNASGGVDVGGSGGEMGYASVHSNRANDQKITQEGMNTNNSMASNGGILHFGQHYNMEGVEEVVMSSNGNSAETETAGLQINYIPKDGGNIYSASGRANFTNEDFQTNNIGAEELARGATTAGSIRKIYDYGLSLGGPIVQDRAWFFTAHRWWGADTFAPGSFFNSVQGTKAANGRPLYAASTERGYLSDPSRENSIRVTIQASSKDKFTYFGNLGKQCVCFRGTSSTRAPRASQITRTDKNHLGQVTWTRAQSNSILIEGGFTYLRNPFSHEPLEGVGPNDINITEQSTNFQYNSWRTSGIPYNKGDSSPADQVNARGALSYVTGSHSFKFGGNWSHGWLVTNGSINTLPGFGPLAIRVLNEVPNRITLYNHPQFKRGDFRNMSFYAQDQWTLDQVTINLGVRGDFFNGWSPDQGVLDTPYITGFAISRIDDTPRWQDVSPRLGVAWDITGDGRTAFKASVGRYVAGEGTGLPGRVNPANRISTTTNRGWDDDGRNGGIANDFFPQGDPSNPLANGELGSSTNAAFGSAVFTRFYDDDNMRGNRPYTWQMSAGVDHELQENFRFSVTYFRTEHYNQTLTDNETLTSADYDPFCVPVPLNAGFPGGGGNTLCGFSNVSFAGRATVPRSVIKLDTQFGDRTEVYHGVDFEVNARFNNGALVRGGVGVGRDVDNNCFVVDSPQELFRCENVSHWWSGGGQIKFSGAYPLPAGLFVSSVFQNVQAVPINATVTFKNAQVARSLGRNLSSCSAPTGACTRTVTVNVFPERNSAFESRITLLDFRVLKDFEADFGRVRVTFDLYNALNASTILRRNNSFGTTGTAWGNVRSIMAGRIIKLGTQFSWN